MRALTSAQSIALPRALIEVQAGLSRLLVERGLINEALSHALEALTIATQASTLPPGRRTLKAIAVAWRVLGLVIGNLPVDERSVMVGNQLQDGDSCFQESMRIFRKLGYGVEAETAYTLITWAKLELSGGDHTRGNSLLSQARDIFTTHVMLKEVSYLNRFNIDSTNS